MNVNILIAESGVCSRQPMEPRLESDSRGTNMSRSPLKVIVASPGHTGTTTMAYMLQILGLRTFKTDDMLFYMGEPLVEEMKGIPVSDERLLSPLRACNVEAWILEPWMDLAPRLLTHSPDARVILTRRKSWQEWVRKATAARDAAGNTTVGYIFTAVMLCHWLPSGLLLHQAQIRDPFMQVSMKSLFVERCVYGFPGSPSEQPVVDYFGLSASTPLLTRIFESEPDYENFLSEVRSLTTPERFLEFDYGKHGWRELAAFLDLPPPEYADDPVPRLRTGDSGQFRMRWEQEPYLCATFWILQICSVILNWMAFNAVYSFCSRCCARRRIKAE